jgi:hypothetical protein
VIDCRGLQPQTHVRSQLGFDKGETTRTNWHGKEERANDKWQRRFEER